MRQGFPASKKDAFQVGAHGLPPNLGSGLLERTKGRDPRVVDQHIQLPELSDRIFDKALYVRLIGHISGMNN